VTKFTVLMALLSEQQPGNKNTRVLIGKLVAIRAETLMLTFGWPRLEWCRGWKSLVMVWSHWP